MLTALTPTQLRDLAESVEVVLLAASRSLKQQQDGLRQSPQIGVGIWVCSQHGNLTDRFLNLVLHKNPNELGR